MRGEFSIARGASGTVMRHFVRAHAFAAPAPVTALALGMTVPAASRVLIPASRPAQRFTPSEAAAARPAVLLAPVTARADEHLAPASGTEKTVGHRPLLLPAGRAGRSAITGQYCTRRPYASADLGAASDVTAKSVQSEAASASSPTPISLQLTGDVIAGTRGARLL